MFFVVKKHRKKKIETKETGSLDGSELSPWLSGGGFKLPAWFLTVEEQGPCHPGPFFSAAGFRGEARAMPASFSPHCRSSTALARNLRRFGSWHASCCAYGRHASCYARLLARFLLALRPPRRAPASAWKLARFLRASRLAWRSGLRSALRPPRPSWHDSCGLTRWLWPVENLWKTC